MNKDVKRNQEHTNTIQRDEKNQHKISTGPEKLLPSKKKAYRTTTWQLDGVNHQPYTTPIQQFIYLLLETNNKPEKKMGNREKILGYLQENPEGICDDCLSIHLDIKPRQQVNQITNRLKAEDIITREKTKCQLCKKKMLVNKLVGEV